MGSLTGRIALVTGASKNIGRAIAQMVAASGATTYITARSMDDVPGRLASLARTASDIRGSGGSAIAVPCDHGDDAQVEELFDTISREHGRLDLVVNVASPDFSAMVGLPFWTLPFRHITECLAIGPRSAYVTTALTARLMVDQGPAVVVNVSSHGAQEYLLSAPYGIGKAALDKVTKDTAFELQAHGIAVVSLWPGFVLTEGVLSRSETTADGRRLLHGLDVDAVGESPALSGKAVVALASDPLILERTGGSYWTSVLAREYGFTEDDGRMPIDMSQTRLVRDKAIAGELPDYWRGVVRSPGNAS